VQSNETVLARTGVTRVFRALMLDAARAPYRHLAPASRLRVLLQAVSAFR